jgi:hypothetical protein
MAENKLGLEQTRNSFQIRGKIIGTGKEQFFKATKTKTNKDFRAINFGVETDKQKTILYCQFNGMPQEFVYFSGKDKDKKNVTEKVKWADRYSWKKDGFRLIGVNLGLEKIEDDKGKEVNKKEYLAPFDACDYVHENMTDGMSVFVKGTIEYGHYTDKNGEVRHTEKLIPNQISLCQPIDFDALDKDGKPYQVVSDFEQKIVFESIEKVEETEGKFNLTAKIINYNSIEVANFVVEDPKLATNFKKKVKPFTAMKVWGAIRTVRNTDEVEVETEDGWGSTNKMQRVNTPYKMEFVILGADPASMDTEEYSEEKIDAAIEKMKKEENKEKSFDTQDDNWGSSSKGKPTEEEDSPWD